MVALASIAACARAAAASSRVPRYMIQVLAFADAVHPVSLAGLICTD